MRCLIWIYSLHIQIFSFSYLLKVLQSFVRGHYTLMDSEWPKLYGVLATLNAIGLMKKLPLYEKLFQNFPITLSYFEHWKWFQETTKLVLIDDQILLLGRDLVVQNPQLVLAFTISICSVA